MKKLVCMSICTFVFILFSAMSVSYAKDYYVSNSGNDSNSGTSSSSPWKTINKVNKFIFAPGDRILFKKGDSWREQLLPQSGSAGNYIEYSSYGEGPKPAIYGSSEANQTTGWKSKGGNIWTIYVTSPINTMRNNARQSTCDVGNIIFNNGGAVGIRVFDKANLTKQNQFFYNSSNRQLLVYSYKNPASLYHDIELAFNLDLVSINKKSYVRVKGLELKYGAACGVFGESTSYIDILDCDIDYIGGGTVQVSGGRTTRYGNGINFWNNVHDNNVEGCRIWEVFDAALSNQGTGYGAKAYNISYKNNTIWNCEYSYEYFNSGSDTVTRDIYFEGNDCKDAGKGWGHTQRPDPKGIHLLIGNRTSKVDNFVVRNNRFINAEHLCVSVYAWNNVDALILDNNDYTTKSEYMFYWIGKSFVPAKFEQYRTLSGKDASSTLY